MIESRDEHFLWVEKYRPQKIDDCILPESIKKTFKEYIAQGELPSFLFSGSAGTGKTTAAKALCNEIGAEYIMINGSDEGRSIDTLRTTIRSFASTVSLTDAKKVVIVDEADYMNAQSVQPALRNFIEEFSSNCRFIFTCNFKNRIIEPLHSRCAVVEFKIDSAEKQTIAAQFFKRVSQILKTENIEFDSKVVAELITKHFPDYRRILNELQRYSVAGKIDSDIMVNMTADSFTELIKHLKDANFTEVRKWVAKQSDSDCPTLFRELFNNASQHLEPNTIPALVVILADYQYKSAFVADQEINTMAALTEIMIQCKFK
jgi:DNA polymerase III delta prime subunit